MAVSKGGVSPPRYIRKSGVFEDKRTSRKQEVNKESRDALTDRLWTLYRKGERMSYIEVQYPAEKPAFYQLLKEQIALYTGGEADRTAVLANASAVIAQAFPDANWVGFYLTAGEELVVGPFQGNPAVSRIGYGRGVCGAAWRENRAQVVADVSCFAGHIACDCNTHSEIVVPLRRPDGSIWGVLDMDSVLSGHFTEEDRAGLEEIAALLYREGVVLTFPPPSSQYG